MPQQPLTLNEFQEQTVKDNTISKHDASLDLICQSSHILSIIKEQDNTKAEITPTGFRDIQLLLGNALRDICVIANSFGYTLGYIGNKTGDLRVNGFTYFYGRELNKEEYEEKPDKQKKKSKVEIATILSKKAEW